MEISLYPAYNTLSKLLAGDPELRRDVMCIGGTSQFPLTCFRGIDQWGERFGYLLLDPMVGAIGAFSFRDGIATGGQVRSPICRIGNVEHNEQSFPILTLYRRENTDSGGAGKYRGGNSAITAFIPHGTSEMWHETESSGAAIPTAPGLFQGYPACTNAYDFRRDTDILRQFRERQMLRGHRRGQRRLNSSSCGRSTSARAPRTSTRSRSRRGAGYGDPLDRDPDAVRRDVENGGHLAGHRADRVPGGAGRGTTRARAFDAASTAALRRQALSGAAGAGTAGAPAVRHPVARRVTEALDLVSAGGRAQLACARCGWLLGRRRKLQGVCPPHRPAHPERPIPSSGDPSASSTPPWSSASLLPGVRQAHRGRGLPRATPCWLGHSTHRGGLIRNGRQRQGDRTAMIPYGLYVLTAETRAMAGWPPRPSTG